MITLPHQFGDLQIAILKTTFTSGVCAALILMPQQAFPFAIGVRESLVMEGVSLYSDSFDSSDPSLSTNGRYDPTKRMDGGDILCGIAFTNTMGTGDVMLTGKIYMGSPGALIHLGPAGSIGDILWVDSVAGIKPGWAVNGVSVAFPSVVPPSGAFTPADGPGTGGSGSIQVQGVSRLFDHVFTESGDYLINHGSNSIYVGTNVIVRLHVTTSVFSPESIYVAGTGSEAGQLIAYLESETVTLGTEHTVQSGRAASLQFYGLPTCHDLQYKGNGNFSGVIYAPDAAVTLMGGGSGAIDFSGCVVAKSMVLQSAYRFHADEALETAIWMLEAPADRFVLAGADATFSVLVSGRVFTREWWFNEDQIPGETNSSLIISNAGFLDAGLYYAVLRTSNHSITSAPAVLGVYASPQASVSAAVSLSNGFRLSVSGVPGFYYRVEASSDLIEWIPVETNTAPFEWVDPAGMDAGQGFFRAVYAP